MNNNVRIGNVSFGRGVFAARRFQKNELVAVIGGRIIDDPHYSSEYCVDLGGSLSLEPKPPFRYLNHCCTPNCQLYLLEESEGGRAGGPPRLILEALKTIQAGAQLTIDYAWPAESAIPCACQSPQCRGWIVDAEDLPQLPQQDVVSEKPALGIPVEGGRFP